MKIKPHINTLTSLAAVAGLVYVAWQFKKLHSAGAGFLAPVSGALGRAWSKMTTGPGVEATAGGVILRPKDFVNGQLKPLAYEAQATMHPENPGILQMILGPGQTLREPYKSVLAQHDIILILPDGSIETGV